MGLVDSAADNFVFTIEQADPAAKGFIYFNLGHIFNEYRLLVAGCNQSFFDLFQGVEQA